ncbi:MAG: hypothetical protein HY273_04670 [Gammaproteobacteria bacterium]|nr:hypothetical protein [Gammaproteobacteria bacterium]
MKLVEYLALPTTNSPLNCLPRAVVGHGKIADPRVIQAIAALAIRGAQTNVICDILGLSDEQTVRAIVRQEVDHYQLELKAIAKKGYSLSYSVGWFLVSPVRMLQAAMLVMMYKKKVNIRPDATGVELARIYLDVYEHYLQMYQGSKDGPAVNFEQFWSVIRLLERRALVELTCNCGVHFLESVYDRAHLMCQTCRLETIDFCRCGHPIPESNITNQLRRNGPYVCRGCPRRKNGSDKKTALLEGVSASSLAEIAKVSSRVDNYDNMHLRRDHTSPSTRTSGYTLTNRQRDIIDLLLIGCSNKQIATKLNLSYGTVKNYLFDLMRLLNVRSRLELVVKITKAPTTQSNVHQTS